MSNYSDYFEKLANSNEKTEEIEFGMVNHKFSKKKRNYKYTHPNQLRTMTDHTITKTNDSKQADLIGALEMLTYKPDPILPISDYQKQINVDSLYGSGEKKPFIISETENLNKPIVEPVVKPVVKPIAPIVKPIAPIVKPVVKPIVKPILPISPGMPITPVPIPPKKQFVEPPLPPGARYIFPNNKVPKKSTIVKGSRLTDGPDGKPYVPKPKPIIPVKPKMDPDAPLVVHGVTAPPMGSVEGDPGYKKPFFSGGTDVNWMPKTGTTMRR
jgi:hypothetical protein